MPTVYALTCPIYDASLLFVLWRAPQQMLRTHCSLEAYCTTLVPKMIVFFVFPYNGAPVEWNWQGKTEVLRENPVHYRFHMGWPGIEPGPQWSKTARLTAWAMARPHKFIVNTVQSIGLPFMHQHTLFMLQITGPQFTHQPIPSMLQHILFMLQHTGSQFTHQPIPSMLQHTIFMLQLIPFMFLDMLCMVQSINGMCKLR
jgi:hypothetical protein